MREGELLTALSHSPYVLQITMQNGRATVRLPHVTGMGESLMAAALDAARKVLKDRRDFPHMEKVLEALGEYNQHSVTLRL